MRISDWSSDVCSSDLTTWARCLCGLPHRAGLAAGAIGLCPAVRSNDTCQRRPATTTRIGSGVVVKLAYRLRRGLRPATPPRSEEHTSELPSLMPIRYPGFGLAKLQPIDHQIRG